MQGTTRHGVAVLLLLGAGTAGAQLFPLPDELRPDVDFWVAIFTEYTTDQGVLHDNRSLGVVYERLDFERGQERRSRQQLIKQRRDQLQQRLRSLAKGRREGLSAADKAILDKWPAGVSNEELGAAAERIRFQQGLSDRFREGLVRAGRWRPFIEAEFRALGVPVELAALPHVESSYNPDARSHVGASGIWQFTRSTGRRFMRIDHVVDERNDPFAATRAAGRLLAYNYSITGNWPMAITAYNHGLAGVRRAMREHGDTAYADIMRKYSGRTFGFASRNFYVAFLAAKQVDQDAERYFPGLVADLPTDYDEVSLDVYVAAADLATALGLTERQLAVFNPSLQATVWQGSKHIPKGFGVRIPQSLLTSPLADVVRGMPASRRHSDQLPDMFHTVVRGDTLSEIAETYGTRVSTLVTLNGLGSSHRIRAGQQLRLPAAGPAPVVAAIAPPAVVAATEPPAATDTALPEAPVPEAPVAAAAVAEAPVPEAPAEPGMVEEVTPSTMADEEEVAAALPEMLQTELLSDPSDYSVAADGTIEVHPLETLGHYADWLEIRTQRLRDVNGLAFRTPVAVGERLRLDLTAVDAATFESRRVAYHRRQQDSFFLKHVITGTTEHVIGRGESIWILSLRQYGVPIWLFRQYNPDVELDAVRPGMTVRFPVMADAPQP
jgi:membrane-bound lytic murein transglycosylase D